MSYAYIMLFFKEDHFISLKRAELFGITDFIANCGGLLGLFMGVSLLSIVEIIYFCTIRWIYRLKGRDQGQHINSTDQLNPAKNGRGRSGVLVVDDSDSPMTRKHLRRY